MFACRVFVQIFLHFFLFFIRSEAEVACMTLAVLPERA